MSREQEISDLLRPTVEAMGYLWWGVEYHPNSVNSILRVYVDKSEGGIGIDDIVAVTEQLNPLLDVENPISGAYTFEVSSPGMDRPLFELSQYALYLGETVSCRLRRALDGRRKFQGELLSVNEDSQSITLALPEGQAPEQVEIALEQIDKARLVPSF